MARYVLVEFEDNAKAKAFVTKVNGAYYAIDDNESVAYRVRAVWAKPTLFCECTKGSRGSNPFRRGEKSGWWVHHDCGRPTRMWAKGNHWFSAIGRNLLPGNTDYTPQGWGVPDKGEPQSGHIIPVGDDAPATLDTMPTGEGELKAERRAQRRALKTERPRRGD